MSGCQIIYAGIRQSINLVNQLISKSLPRHPLSERGARRAGCVALLEKHCRNNASHCWKKPGRITKLEKMTHPDTQRNTAKQQTTQPTKSQPIKPPSPPYVQYMYSICTVFVRFGSVQILYIYCTYTVQRAEKVPQTPSFQLLTKPHFCGFFLPHAMRPLCGRAAAKRANPPEEAKTKLHIF